MIEETLIDDKSGRLREIKMLKAQRLFDEKKFRDSLDLFSEVSAPPERVIRLYPEMIAGKLFAGSEPESTSAASQAKKSHQKTISVASTASKKTGKVETASIRSTKTVDKESGQGLGEKELKPAVRELQAFLADCRRRLQRFFNPDQTVKSLDEVQELSQSEDLRQILEHLLGSGNLEDVDIADKITDTARLVDTTLFRAHMYATPSLAGSLFRISNFCDPDVVMTRLEESGRYNDLIDFLYGKRLHRQALERLQKFGQSADTEKVDSQLQGPSRTVSYLQALPHELVDLILEFARWPIQTDPNLGMGIFLADTENAELLARDKVLRFLESEDKKLAQRYLEHVIEEWDDLTPEIHQKLVSLCLDRLKDTTSSDHQQVLDSFMTFLQSSSQYSPAKVMNVLPRDEPEFHEARAILFSKMGNHKQALEIYVFKLDDPAKAEEYCNEMHLEAATNTSKHTSRRKSTTDPVDEEPSIYHVLLNLYLNPPKGEKSRWGPAIELMAKHGARLPASSTLETIPPELLIRELEFYFRGRIRNANSIMNESKIVTGLRKVDAVRVQSTLLLGEGLSNGGRSRRVRINEERVCGVCHKRLGGSVISVFPDNSVVHLGCANRRQNELQGR
jgi:Vam6/Vps39-like protein vacuolar protein sorting-associated protein 39